MSKFAPIAALVLLIGLVTAPVSSFAQTATTTTDSPTTIKAQLELIMSLLKQIQELKMLLQQRLANQQNGKWNASSSNKGKNQQKFVFNKQNASSRDDDDDEDNDNDSVKSALVPCAKVPPGHLIAPGWLKKKGGVAPVINPCQTLPYGIAKKINPNTPKPGPAPTSTVALAISDIALTPSTSTLTVAWKTNLPANSQIAYGTTVFYGSLTALNSTLVTAHSQVITGLTPNTTYHLQIISKDAANQTATSADLTVATQLLPDITAPVISAVSVTASTTSALISWTTNEPATTKVYFTSTLPIDITLGSTPAFSNGSLVTGHSAQLNGLTASTTYAYVVESKDANNNTATTSPLTFTTN